MARKAHRNRDEERPRRRGGDQVILALLLWIAPMSLFAYVGFKIAEASGKDPYAYLPQVELWQVALLGALFLGSVTAFVAYRVNTARLHAAHRRGRFDSRTDSV